MQYNRKADGSLENLPNHHVDTGMGFERFCMAVQGKTSNYDTDVFTPIIDEISRLSGLKYGVSHDADVAMRVIGRPFAYYFFLYYRRAIAFECESRLCDPPDLAESGEICLYLPGSEGSLCTGWCLF